MIAYWVSEPDRGQCHAMNKGFARATGDIHYWLCVDDMLEPGALFHAAEKLSVTDEPQWLVGAARLIYGRNRTMSVRRPEVVNRDTFLRWASNWIPTQATFWNRPMWEQAGPFDEHIHYVMDLTLWERMYRVKPPIITPRILGAYRFHADANSIVRTDEAKKERLSYMEYLLKQEWSGRLGAEAGAELDELLRDYARALEEASDYRGVLDNINNHKLFGPLYSCGGACSDRTSHGSETATSNVFRGHNGDSVHASPVD